jgi:hypothetical protein
LKSGSGGVKVRPPAGVQLPTLADALLSHAVSDADMATIIKGLKIDGQPIDEKMNMKDILKEIKTKLDEREALIEKNKKSNIPYPLYWKIGYPTTEIVPALYNGVLNYSMKMVNKANDNKVLEEIRDPDARLLFIDALFSSGPSAGAAKIRQAIELTQNKFNLSVDDKAENEMHSHKFMDNTTLEVYGDLSKNDSQRKFMLDTLSQLIDKQFE